MIGASRVTYVYGGARPGGRHPQGVPTMIVNGEPVFEGGHAPREDPMVAEWMRRLAMGMSGVQAINGYPPARRGIPGIQRGMGYGNTQPMLGGLRPLGPAGMQGPSHTLIWDG